MFIADARVLHSLRRFAYSSNGVDDNLPSVVASRQRKQLLDMKFFLFRLRTMRIYAHAYAHHEAI